MLFFNVVDTVADAGCRLHHLPVELGQCSLKAIWLSENQAQSMLKFQEDVDEQTGRTVLTCFLLPQQSYHTESMGTLFISLIILEIIFHNHGCSGNGTSLSFWVFFHYQQPLLVVSSKMTCKTDHMSLRLSVQCHLFQNPETAGPMSLKLGV